MAGPLRLESAGALYHVTARGNERRSIFLGDAGTERAGFLDGPGSRDLLREALPSALVLPPPGMTPLCVKLGPARRSCVRWASREVGPPCFGALTSHPAFTTALSQPQPRPSGQRRFPIRLSVRPVNEPLPEALIDVFAGGEPKTEVRLASGRYRGA